MSVSNNLKFPTLRIDDNWDRLYDALGIRGVIDVIVSSELQQELLLFKIVFILFTVFFFGSVIYFYVRSSYLQHNFLEDTMEFFSWQPYGLRQINKRWQKLMKRIKLGNETEYRLAVIEADDLLYDTLEESGYSGETFEDIVKRAGKKILPSAKEIMEAHEIRNSIVYNPDYRLDAETAKKILENYEKAAKNI